MKAVIVCGGSIKDPRHIGKYLEEADLIIAADSGAAFLESIGVRPHLLAGDFDSISEKVYEAVTASGIQVLKFPAEKDMTDSELAVELALERDCDNIVLLGAIGTRLDHSLSNIHLLKKILRHEAKGMLADEHNEVFLIGEAKEPSPCLKAKELSPCLGTVTVEREEGAVLSLLPLTDRVEGVTTQGLYYPLKDAVLETGSSLGVSNVFVEASATVTVSSGLLLVIKSRD
jgi:thiamine pyrophosphokinase